MHGGDLAYNPRNLKGNTAVEKLRYFLSEVKIRLRKLGLDSGSKVRFRGDVLEISVDRSELTPHQNQSANDSLIYIKTGLLISLLTKVISNAGFKPVVRTFPRFDEPDLVGFVYIGDDMASSRRKKNTGSIADIKNRIEGYEFTVAEKIASKRSLSLSVIVEKRELKKVREALQVGLEHCQRSELNPGLLAQIDEIASEEFNSTDKSVLIVSSRQNTPTAWIGTGFFLGEMMTELSELKTMIYPISLKSCPSRFQGLLREITEGSARHPQLVCMIDKDEQKGINP